MLPLFDQNVAKNPDIHSQTKFLIQKPILSPS